MSSISIQRILQTCVSILQCIFNYFRDKCGHCFYQNSYVYVFFCLLFFVKKLKNNRLKKLCFKRDADLRFILHIRKDADLRFILHHRSCIFIAALNFKSKSDFNCISKQKQNCVQWHSEALLNYIKFMCRTSSVLWRRLIAKKKVICFSYIFFCFWLSVHFSNIIKKNV